LIVVPCIRTGHDDGVGDRRSLQTLMRSGVPLRDCTAVLRSSGLSRRDDGGNVDLAKLPGNPNIISTAYGLPVSYAEKGDPYPQQEGERRNCKNACSFQRANG
jgi:hypothetical protein